MNGCLRVVLCGLARSYDLGRRVQGFGGGWGRKTGQRKIGGRRPLGKNWFKESFVIVLFVLDSEKLCSLQKKSKQPT